MGSGTFRLKGSSILSRAKSNKGIENPHQLSFESKLSHQTIYRYFSDEPLKAIDLRALANLLIEGVGFSPEELQNVRFGDIFEYVTEDEMRAAE